MDKAELTASSSIAGNPTKEKGYPPNLHPCLSHQRNYFARLNSEADVIQHFDLMRGSRRRRRGMAGELCPAGDEQSEMNEYHCVTAMRADDAVPHTL